MLDERLTTYDEFIVAAAQDVTTTYEIDGSLCDVMTRYEMFQVYLRNLVKRQMRDYDNNHRATASAGYVSRFLSGYIARDSRLTLHEKISYRGRVSSRAYAY